MEKQNWQQQQKNGSRPKTSWKCNILAREDEKLNQTVMNGEEKGRE